MVAFPVRTLGLAVAAVVAGPLALLVAVPTVVTFLGWLVGIPAAFLAEIVPPGDGSPAGTRRGG